METIKNLPFIIAVDFDGTLCENKWPDIGQPNEELIEDMILRKAHGDKIILWTCRTGEKLKNAITWCNNHGLYFNAVNANIPEIMELFEYDEGRKIFANLYIDDRAIRACFEENLEDKND